MSVFGLSRLILNGLISMLLTVGVITGWNHQEEPGLKKMLDLFWFLHHWCYWDVLDLSCCQSSLH